MTITYKEMKKAILDELYNGRGYGEVLNGRISVVVQTYSDNRWRVQFYHELTSLMVQAEFILDNKPETLELIHQMLVHFEQADLEHLRVLKDFTFNLLVVRKKEEEHSMDMYKIETLEEFLQTHEMMRNDEEVVEILDGAGRYPLVKKQLEKYNIEI